MGYIETNLLPYEIITNSIVAELLFVIFKNERVTYPFLDRTVLKKPYQPTHRGWLSWSMIRKYPQLARLRTPKGYSNKSSDKGLLANMSNERVKDICQDLVEKNITLEQIRRAAKKFNAEFKKQSVLELKARKKTDDEL